jgi:hypothetical protein
MEPEDAVSEDAIYFHNSPPCFGSGMCYRATIVRFNSVYIITYIIL